MKNYTYEKLIVMYIHYQYTLYVLASIYISRFEGESESTYKRSNISSPEFKIIDYFEEALMFEQIEGKRQGWRKNEEKEKGEDYEGEGFSDQGEMDRCQLIVREHFRFDPLCVCIWASICI